MRGSKGGVLESSSNQQSAPQNPNYDPSSPSPRPQAKPQLEKAFSEYVQQQEEVSTQKKAKQLGLSYVNLAGYPINSQTLALIPEDMARKYKAVAFLKAEGRLRVACVDPKNQEMRQKLEQIVHNLGLELVFTVASETSLKYALENYKFVPKQSAKKEIELTQAKEQDLAKQIKNLADLKDKISQVPTTKIFEIILAGAVSAKASDIHIEPVQNGMRLRYRIDGVLQDVATLPIETYRSLLSRVKYLAKMKLDVKDKPQNGRFSVTAAGAPLDLRVSVLPTIYGENIVMRLLKHEFGFLTLGKLGFSSEVKKLVEKNIKKPTGMILNTGPTGSGKTTTLYAILDYLNKPGVKIITLEDPVEYRVAGITQTQVDPEKDLSFAVGLKSALRQDPDILLVGEIRDLETAETAVQAGLTGHLVLSTLHTNNAPAALPRLLDLGVRPFLLPGSINLIMAQRLVRKICSACKTEYQPKPGVVDKIKKSLANSKLEKIKIPSKLWYGKGCSQCNNTGFSGRTPIVEAFEPNPEIEKMVTEKSPISLLFKKAVELGMITMEQDGIRKVLAGETTIDEVWRVTASEV